ncbi:kinase-like domain-containing protein [Spinellus fusiger]|nr:kinase-like domain-containing protein [Spinellus fusiger]
MIPQPPSQLQPREVTVVLSHPPLADSFVPTFTQAYTLEDAFVNTDTSTISVHPYSQAPCYKSDNATATTITTNSSSSTSSSTSSSSTSSSSSSSPSSAFSLSTSTTAAATLSSTINTHTDTHSPTPALPHTSPPPTTASSTLSSTFTLSTPAIHISPPDAGFWAIPPRKPRTSEYWGERPPVTVVCQHMEHYFDKNDLDLQVMSPLEGTQSIRKRAQQATRNYLATSPHDGTLLRRKSTKLWDKLLVQVKPKYTDPEATSHHKAVQWIRGQLLGKGSFGRVYLAFNIDTGDVMAVKQVELCSPHERLNVHEKDMVHALHQEMVLLRDLEHDNIVQYLGYGEDKNDNMVHIFLEYVSGGSIASRLALQGGFDERLTRYFTRQILLGLAYLHSKHILHRDIKAANILVEVDGVCKISDFGLSKKNDYHEAYDANSRMSLRGSIYWMAPEVVKNEPYSAKVDIWSLGCTVIEMITGQRPWIAFSQIATLYNLGCLKAPSIPESISEQGKDFLSRCLQSDPRQRPTAQELLSHSFCQLDASFDFNDYVNTGKV